MVAGVWAWWLVSTVGVVVDPSMAPCSGQGCVRVLESTAHNQGLKGRVLRTLARHTGCSPHFSHHPSRIVVYPYPIQPPFHPTPPLHLIPPYSTPHQAAKFTAALEISLSILTLLVYARGVVKQNGTCLGESREKQKGKISKVIIMGFWEKVSLGAGEGL